MTGWIIKYFFPVRLKALREEKKLNQESLALELDVNQRTISNWEKSKAEPSLAKLIELADIFHVTVDYLLCLDKETYALLSKAVSIAFDTPHLIKGNDLLLLQTRIKDIPCKTFFELY